MQIAFNIIDGEKNKKLKVCMRHLLYNGADPNVKDRRGRTLLLLATIQDRKAEVALLLKYKADPNIFDSKGCTPLCMSELTSITKLLLKHGADVNHQTKAGETALHFAAIRVACYKKFLKENVNLLISAGADLNIKNKKGETALSSAIHLGIDWSRKLLQEKMESNIPTHSGQWIKN